jgi:hypothetical protein
MKVNLFGITKLNVLFVLAILAQGETLVKALNHGKEKCTYLLHPVTRLIMEK